MSEFFVPSISEIGQKPLGAKMNIIKIKLLSVTVISIIAVFSNTASAISKCKDANGKWIYGDSVEHLCKKSEVTKMNGRAVVKKKLAPEKTPEQIEADKNKLTPEEIAQEKQREKIEKKRILQSYESEEYLEKVRQQKIASYESRKSQYSDYLTYLNKRKEIFELRKGESLATFQKVQLDKDIAKNESDIEKTKQGQSKIDASIKTINEQYDAELELYRKYTAEQESLN